MLITSASCVALSGATDSGCGVREAGDDEDFGEKVAITMATNINKPSRETEEIN